MAIARPTRRLLQNHDTLVVWFQRLVDVTIIVGVLLGLAWWRNGEVHTPYRYLAIVGVLLMLYVYHVAGVYRKFAGPIEGVQHLARAWGVVVMALGAVAFATKSSADFSRAVILVWTALAFVLQAVCFLLTQFIYQISRRRVRVPTLIIGTGVLAEHLANSIRRNSWLPDHVCGVLTESSLHQPHWNLDAVPVLGTTAELDEVVRTHGIRRVYVAVPLHLTHQVETIRAQLFNHNVDVIWAPDIFGLNLLNHSVREMAGVPLITLSETPLLSGGRAFIKTLMDRILAVIALVLLSPVMIATTVLIKLTSEGPVIFKQPRHGWDGRIFEVYKFRSMYLHEEEAGTVTQASKDDSRITPIGRLIRKLSIDELPQLFNVLEGSMSLVGPRPHAVAHNDFYSDKVNDYLARHRIKPGMTGLAQINGYRGETDSLEKMQKRVELDLQYINNWSPWMDLKVLALTPFRLFSKAAY